MRSPSPSASSPPHPCSRTTHQTLIPNPKQTQNVKQTHSNPKQKKKKNEDPSDSLEDSGDEEARGGRERERKREPAGNPRILARSLSVFQPQIQPSVGFGRIRPKTFARSRRTSRSHRPSRSRSASHSCQPSRSRRRPSSIAGRRGEEERQRALRDMVFFGEMKKNNVF
jgi:hypothetical protein